MPTGFEGCTILSEESPGSSVCNTISTNPGLPPGEIYKCYQGELCKNKDMVERLYTIRNNHYLATESYKNIESKYRFESFKMLNLFIGIIATIVFIHYNKQSV